MTALRPLWLITLADLSLLLVGFFVFLQATAHKQADEQAAISAGIREAFGGDEAAAPLPVEANMVAGFAPGRADPPALGEVAAWARAGLGDPRTRLVVTGYADGSAADRLDGSALALAGLRAERVAAALPVDPKRLRVAASGTPGARRVTLSITFDP